MSLSYFFLRILYCQFQCSFLFLFPFISRVKNNGYLLKTERQSDIANNEKHVKYDKVEEIHTSKKLQKIAHFNSKNILNAGQSFISPFVGSKMETLQRLVLYVCVSSSIYLPKLISFNFVVYLIFFCVSCFVYLFLVRFYHADIYLLLLCLGVTVLLDSCLLFNFSSIYTFINLHLFSVDSFYLITLHFFVFLCVSLNGFSILILTFQ
jgi:hypothetical protein